MSGPAATESGPVLRRPTRTCLGLDRPRHSHTRWTRSRGLDRVSYRTPRGETFSKLFRHRAAAHRFARKALAHGAKPRLHHTTISAWNELSVCRRCDAGLGNHQHLDPAIG
jgi:hypothetical protein